jgi:hypothetical protein
METTNLIPPEELLQEIQPLTTALYESFAEGVRIALPYFTDRQVKVDNILLSGMVRFEVKRLLTANGVPVTDDEHAESEDLPMEELALLGLAGFYKGYHFKIRKSPDGTLPVPASDTQWAFYGQQLVMKLPDQSEVRLNIMLLWRFDSSWTNMELTLSVPQSGGHTRESVKEYYRIAIPHLS